MKPWIGSKITLLFKVKSVFGKSLSKSGLWIMDYYFITENVSLKLDLI